MKFNVTNDGERVVYSTNRQGQDEPASTVIVADRAGVQVVSTWGLIRRQLDLDDFLITMRKAWAHHEFLQRNMVHGAVLDESMAQRQALERAAYVNAQMAARSVR